MIHRVISFQIVGFVVPRVMQLKTMYIEAAGSEDFETCRGLCRIFTEMAESYIELIIGIPAILICSTLIEVLWLINSSQATMI